LKEANSSANKRTEKRNQMSINSKWTETEIRRKITRKIDSLPGGIPDRES